MARKSLIAMIKAAGETETDYAEKLTADFTHAVQKWDKINKRVPSNSFKPSSFRCLRCGVMQVLGLPQDEGEERANMIGICAGGSFIHEYVQHIIYRMKEMGMSWEYVDVAKYVSEKKLPLEIISPSDFENNVFETKLYSERYNFRFLCDGIIKIKNKYFILEIKSISSNQFFKLKEIPKKYRTQAISYSSLLRIDDVIFLFVDRDLFNTKSFMLTATQKEKSLWQGKVLAGLKYVEDSIRSRERILYVL